MGDQEENEMVFYDGRWTPISQASAFIQEDVKRQQDFLKEHPEQVPQVPDLPENTPVAEWDRQKLSLDERFKTFWAEENAKAEKLAAKQNAETTTLEFLGIVEPIDPAHLPEGVFTFAQVLDPALKWCRYTREKWFVKFLRNFGYSEDFIAQRVITRIGYEKLVLKEQNEQTTRKTQNKQNERAQQAAPGKQVPEPNKRGRSKKPRVAKRKV